MSKASHLKDIGLKATGPRLTILELFENSETRHLSAEDIYRKLLSDEVDIGLATIYRVLTQFEQAGILVRHHFESGKAVYELNQGGHHDHMVCVGCGTVTEFFDPEIERLQERIAKQHGFAIQDHSLYLYGECAQCQSKRAPGKR
ncbi:ferric iron uptake transcriptional regulator [Crenobacter intestini]|uniref:Ferric uptake regulation protein n=1 Tax=Crenobacter intestini TaxID=2563443 RepID=A0A4T0UVV0_9NEIS|nr:ferric iron uptake transcriptional regulator [Crenobacter intestini]TIC83068.1 ferric iron uptake transcriptional regulator [Crenobacter intestini]